MFTYRIYSVHAAKTHSQSNTYMYASLLTLYHQFLPRKMYYATDHREGNVLLYYISAELWDARTTYTRLYTQKYLHLKEGLYKCVIPHD